MSVDTTSQGQTGATGSAGDAARFHMTPEEFRRHGRAVVDWVADYMERVETLPVASRV